MERYGNDPWVVLKPEGSSFECCMDRKLILIFLGVMRVSEKNTYVCYVEAMGLEFLGGIQGGLGGMSWFRGEEGGPGYVR